MKFDYNKKLKIVIKFRNHSEQRIERKIFVEWLTCGSWKLCGSLDEYHGNMSDPSIEECERPREWPNSWAATANRLVGGWLSELEKRFQKKLFSFPIFGQNKTKLAYLKLIFMSYSCHRHDSCLDWITNLFFPKHLTLNKDEQTFFI